MARGFGFRTAGSESRRGAHVIAETTKRQPEPSAASFCFDDRCDRLLGTEGVVARTEMRRPRDGQARLSNQLRREQVNARSDNALAHPNPVAIEMRWNAPPRPARGGKPPNAATNSCAVPAITMADPAE